MLKMKRKMEKKENTGKERRVECVGIFFVP